MESRVTADPATTSAQAPSEAHRSPSKLRLLLLVLAPLAVMAAVDAWQVWSHRDAVEAARTSLEELEEARQIMMVLAVRLRENERALPEASATSFGELTAAACDALEWYESTARERFLGWHAAGRSRTLEVLARAREARHPGFFVESEAFEIVAAAVEEANDIERVASVHGEFAQRHAYLLSAGPEACGESEAT